MAAAVAAAAGSQAAAEGGVQTGTDSDDDSLAPYDLSEGEDNGEHLYTCSARTLASMCPCKGTLHGLYTWRLSTLPSLNIDSIPKLTVPSQSLRNTEVQHSKFHQIYLMSSLICNIMNYKKRDSLSWSYHPNTL